MTNKTEIIEDELKEMAIGELRVQLEEYLHGLVICDDISRDEEEDILDDFDDWSENAVYGDVYQYDDIDYTLEEPKDI